VQPSSGKVHFGAMEMPANVLTLSWEKETREVDFSGILLAKTCGQPNKLALISLLEGESRLSGEVMGCVAEAISRRRLVCARYENVCWLLSRIGGSC